MQGQVAVGCKFFPLVAGNSLYCYCSLYSNSLMYFKVKQYKRMKELESHCFASITPFVSDLQTT